MAQARVEGYHHTATMLNDKLAPYHGYYFKILTRQGKHAPGGKYDYLINGRMLAGFALVAWPAEWGNTGLMTFIVNQQGKVYQKNLGPKTAKLAEALTPTTRTKPGPRRSKPAASALSGASWHCAHFMTLRCFTSTTSPPPTPRLRRAGQPSPHSEWRRGRKPRRRPVGSEATAHQTGAVSGYAPARPPPFCKLDVVAHTRYAHVLISRRHGSRYNMMNNYCWSLLLAAALPAAAAAADLAPTNAPAGTNTPAPKTDLAALPDASHKPVLITNTVTIAGESVTYSARDRHVAAPQAGRLPRASVFYVAYTRLAGPTPPPGR